MSEILVLGRGRLGRSLTGALAVAGVPARLLPGRDWEESLQVVLESPGCLVVLAVPDQFIVGLAERLAERLADGPGLAPGASFVHLSGALGLGALQPLGATRRRVGCFHPLQPFPAVRGPEAFHGCVCSLDASHAELYTELEALARALGAVPRRLTEQWRPLYHAAAVMASSYLVVLAAQAGEMLQAAGWSRPDALQALLPLMRGTLDNLGVEGLPGGLSGPMRRGDAATVARHIEAIESTPAMMAETAKIYRLLGQAAIGLAAETGLPASEVRALERAVAGHDRASGR
jgi:predicted short-subunit dehydrogenase-like oxidoreductase (DUF2520 family)